MLARRCAPAAKLGFCRKPINSGKGVGKGYWLNPSSEVAGGFIGILTTDPS